MFVRRNVLRSLMTRSYKGGGLFVRNDGVGMTICGAKWAVYFINGDMPKEVMGDLITLVGILPDKGEAYTADKNGNQMEIYDSEMLVPIDIPSEKELEIIPLIACGVMGILQCPESGKIIPVNATHLSAIDYGCLVGDEETPSGPFGVSGLIAGRFYNAACWKNDRMAYAIGEMRGENEIRKRIISYLETIDWQRLKDETKEN